MDNEVRRIDEVEDPFHVTCEYCYGRLCELKDNITEESLSATSEDIWGCFDSNIKDSLFLDHRLPSRYTMAYMEKIKGGSLNVSDSITSNYKVMCYAIHGVLTALLSNEFDEHVSRNAILYCVRCLEMLSHIGETRE